MLRSPTHIVGHGPTSTSSSTTQTQTKSTKNSSSSSKSATAAAAAGAGGAGGITSPPHHQNVHVNHHLHLNNHHNNNNNNNNNNSKTNGTNSNCSNNSSNGHINGGATVNGNATKLFGNFTSLSQHHHNSTTTTAAAAATTPTSITPATPTPTTTTRSSLFDSCHRKIRLIGGGPVAFLGGLVAKARRKERDGDQSSTDTKLYLEESVLERKLPDADLKALVDLPAGLDYNEWLASHTLALFEHVNLVYGTISEFCTTSGCPDMTGPGSRTYLWFDEKGKKTRVAAPQYIDYVMTFTQKTVSDESIFPTKYANEFPSSFESIARKILRLQFHVIAHLYAAHFREIALLGLHTHLNLTFAHLTALHRRFNLIDEKETDVLRDLEIALRLTDDGSSTTTTTTTTTTNNTNNSTATTTNTTTTTLATNSITSNDHHHHNTTSGGTGTLLQLTGNEQDTTNSLGYHQHQQQQQQHINIMNSSSAAIDGDASIQPICTQPEAMKGLNSDQSDIRGGAGGGGGGGGVVAGTAGINVLGGYCSNNSGLNSSHIGGIMNFNNNNNNTNNNNNNHNNSSTHPLTQGSLIQCNSSTSSSSNSHTTTTA